MPHKGNGHTPHLLSKKVFLLTIAIVGMVELSLIAMPRLGVDLAAVLPSVVTMLTNEVRAEGGLKTLTPNELLTKAAQAKADDMASRGYFAHRSPDGRQPWDWISAAGYAYEHAGENLAVNFYDSEEVVKAWRNSPTHNLNLVGPRYTEIGVAVAEGSYEGRPALFVVQMFASPIRPAFVPASAPVPAQPAPKQKAPSSPVEVARQVAQNSAPAEEVLSATVAELKSPSMPTRVLASSRTYGAYLYTLLGALFLFVLVLGFTPLVHGTHHPKAAMRGVVLTLALWGLIFFNDFAAFAPVELPVDSDNAALALSAL